MDRKKKLKLASVDFKELTEEELKSVRGGGTNSERNPDGGTNSERNPDGGTNSERNPSISGTFGGGP